jgi:hypothetical protein
MRTRTAGRILGIALVATASATVGSGVAGAVSPTPTIVVSGLNNPRQISLTRGGDLLIAEAGNGGATKIGGKGKNAQFVGESGSVSLVTDPATGSNETPNRILGGFLSEASSDGSQAVGSDGVAARSKSAIYVIETWAPVTVPPFLPNQLGQLFVAKQHGLPTEVTNIATFNQSTVPDKQLPFDSDPYAILITGDTTELVADAASNDIVSVTNGTPSLFHVFPNVTTGKCAKRFDPNPSFPGCNFVPTAMAKDRSGNIYVTGLASLVPGQGQVVELDPSGANVLHTWTGFTAPDGIIVSGNGNIYVSQLLAAPSGPPSPMSTPGVVTEILASGSQVSMNVSFPAGLALDDSANLYVSAFSIASSTGLGAPGTSGEVLRFASAS